MYVLREHPNLGSCGYSTLNLRVRVKLDMCKLTAHSSSNSVAVFVLAIQLPTLTGSSFFSTINTEHL